MSTASTSAGQTTATESGEPELRIWSCVICRRRKIRCDRQDPCSNCTKNNIECHFPVTGRLPRRSRDPNSALKPSPQRQSELIGRLRRLEAVVTELTAQVEDGSGNAPGHVALPTPVGSTDASTSDSGLHSEMQTTMGDSKIDELDEDFGALVVDEGNGLHIGKGFWTIFCSEVDSIFQAVQDVASADGQDMRNHSSNHEDWSKQHNDLLQMHATQALVFGNTPDTGVDNSLYPLPSQMLFIWQTFEERVDPFVKVLHVPSMTEIVKSLRGSFRSLGPNMSALLSAISFASIASLDEDEIAVNFGTSKEELLCRFRRGTEISLSQADLLVTKELDVIRAFVIYLSILPHLGEASQSRVYPLSGLLERMATSAGLYRDAATWQPSSSDLVFETEMNCRLRWQMCFIDSQARDMSASHSFASETQGQLPRPADNDDVEIHSTSSYESLQSPKTKSTDMTLCLIRCELQHLSRSLASSNKKTVHAHLDIFNRARLSIEKMHLQYLQPDRSVLNSFIKSMAGLFFSRVEQIIYRQHLQQSTMETDGYTAALNQQVVGLLLSSSVFIIAALHRLKTEPDFHPWRWHFHGHIPWYSMGTILTHVSARPWTAESERAWATTKRMFDALPEKAKNEDKWQPLSRLVANTQKWRDRNLAQTETRVLTNAEATGDTVNTNSVSMIEQVLADQEVSLGFMDHTAYAMDATATPMDWRTWEDVSGTPSLWNFSEF